MVVVVNWPMPTGSTLRKTGIGVERSWCHCHPFVVVLSTWVPFPVTATAAAVRLYRVESFAHVIDVDPGQWPVYRAGGRLSTHWPISPGASKLAAGRSMRRQQTLW
jgi:hypothetical protein